MSLREFAKFRSRSYGRRRRDVYTSSSESSSSSSSSTRSSSSERREKRRVKKSKRKDRHSKKHKKEEKHNKIKRKPSDTSSSSDSDDFEKREKKSKHKHERKKSKKKKKKKKKKGDIKTESNLYQTKQVECSIKSQPADKDIQGPVELQETVEQPRKRTMAPMTKEEYEKQQSKVRRVYDPETGRNRLVKGDGEIIEEIVSYDRHKTINKMATQGDGMSFQATLQQGKFS